MLGTLLSFLATRQIFTGAGRVGQASPLAFDFESAPEPRPFDFQISQRADHIVNDIYQWVQFNRAIINARDEPLADYRKYRRLHLLIGDSNMSPFACALKVGTTSLHPHIARGRARCPTTWFCAMPCSRPGRSPTKERAARSVPLEDGRTRDALDIQDEFLAFARRHFAGMDEETDWILESWSYTLDALRSKPELLLGGVDWISKKWMLEQFREAEGLEWQDPWMQSLDLEYHNIDPAKGLFFAVTPAKAIGEFNEMVRQREAVRIPPPDTRACGRGRAVALFRDSQSAYVVNWDSVSIENDRHVAMPDPFETYVQDMNNTFSRAEKSPRRDATVGPD